MHNLETSQCIYEAWMSSETQGQWCVKVAAPREHSAALAIFNPPPPPRKECKEYLVYSIFFCSRYLNTWTPADLSIQSFVRIVKLLLQMCREYFPIVQLSYVAFKIIRGLQGLLNIWKQAIANDNLMMLLKSNCSGGHTLKIKEDMFVLKSEY